LKEIVGGFWVVFDRRVLATKVPFKGPMALTVSLLCSISCY
jgi:hypothetical protein